MEEKKKKILPLPSLGQPAHATALPAAYPWPTDGLPLACCPPCPSALPCPCHTPLGPTWARPVTVPPSPSIRALCLLAWRPLDICSTLPTASGCRFFSPVARLFSSVHGGAGKSEMILIKCFLYRNKRALFVRGEGSRPYHKRQRQIFIREQKMSTVASNGGRFFSLSW